MCPKEVARVAHQLGVAIRCCDGERIASCQATLRRLHTASTRESNTRPRPLLAASPAPGG